MIKRWFLEKFPTCICKGNKPALCELGKLDSPVVFCVDGIADQISQESGKKKKKRCDEFVFCDIKNATGIYCIENKGGKNIDLSKIRKQLQGGAKIIEKRLDPSEAFGFMPVLVTSGIPPSYLKELINKKYRVKFRKIAERYYIQHIMVDNLSDKRLSSLPFRSIITP